METAIVLDCEFLVSDGAQSRFWCGPFDPDPVVVQVGAIKLGLCDDFPILDTFETLILPTDRTGNPVELDPVFITLTGITSAMVAANGVSLSAALVALQGFAAGARLWSWGKDELNLMAISCYITGIAPPIPAARFGNACSLLLQAGMPYQDIKTTRSHRLADYFNLAHPPLQSHKAVDDARNVAFVLQYLLQTKKLPPTALL